MKGTHTYKKEHRNQTSTCSLWSLSVHPFPSIVEMLEVYLEERRNITDTFSLTHTYPNRPTISPFVKSQTPKKPRDSKKRSRKVHHHTNRKQFYMRKSEKPFSLSKATVPTFMLALMPTTSTAATTKATLPIPSTTATVTLLVPSNLPSTLNTPTMPKAQPSSQMSKP